MRVALLLLPLRNHARQWRLASTAIRRRLTVAQVRGLVETALELPSPPGHLARPFLWMMSQRELV
jgi:hypothetical protein